MSFATPTIINAAAVVNGDNATPAFMNANLDPLKNFTALVDGLTRISTASATYNVTANTEVVIYVDASGGDRIVNLPDCAGQLHSITIKKIDVSYNIVTVNSSGADTIESSSSNALSPATTSHVIAAPNSARTFSPNGTQWRVEASYDTYLIAFRAYLSSAITMNPNSGIQTVINMDNDSAGGLGYDIGNNYNTTTKQFTAPFTGLYQFSGQFRESGAGGTTNHFVAVRYFKNGAGLAYACQLALNSSSITGDYFAPFSTLDIPLTVGDTMDVRYTLGTGAIGTMQAGADSTYWSGRLILPLI